jgi:homoserine dehydrogenase
VTANKAMLAKHGLELASIAEKKHVSLAFEAAIAGGIPVVKALKEGLAANQISRVAGILNGTCNYILTAMQQNNQSFESVLSEAQEKGYAEADPAFDVDGIDTAHKLVLLTSLAFGVQVGQKITTEGIRHITLADLGYAKELGYTIILLGLCEATSQGIRQTVYPALVPLESPIAGVAGVHNAVLVQGDAVGSVMFEGPGAGEGATASSVVADIIDIASKRYSHPFGLPVTALQKAKFLPLDSRVGEYYLRIEVKDEPGVLARITKELERNGVSLEAVIQRPPRQGQNATIVTLTHEASEKTLCRAVDKIALMTQVASVPTMIRVESL